MIGSKHFIYTGAGLGHKPKTDGRRCREAVHDSMPRSVGHHQCTRTGTVKEVVDGEEMWFCKQHSLKAQQERQAKSDAKLKAEMDADDRRANVEHIRRRIVSEVMAIAESDRLTGIPSLPGDLGKLSDDLWHLEKKRNGKG